MSHLLNKSNLHQFKKALNGSPIRNLCIIWLPTQDIVTGQILNPETGEWLHSAWSINGTHICSMRNIDERCLIYKKSSFETLCFSGTFGGFFWADRTNENSFCNKMFSIDTTVTPCQLYKDALFKRKTLLKELKAQNKHINQMERDLIQSFGVQYGDKVRLFDIIWTVLRVDVTPQGRPKILLSHQFHDGETLEYTINHLKFIKQ